MLPGAWIAHLAKQHLMTPMTLMQNAGKSVSGTINSNFGHWLSLIFSALVHIVMLNNITVCHFFLAKCNHYGFWDICKKLLFDHYVSFLVLNSGHIFLRIKNPNDWFVQATLRNNYTNFHWILPSSFRGEDFWKNVNDDDNDGCQVMAIAHMAHTARWAKKVHVITKICWLVWEWVICYKYIATNHERTHLIWSHILILNQIVNTSDH